MSNVIENIEKIRKSKGTTKAHISRYCGHTYTWYTQIASGKTRLTVDDAILIAKSMDEDVRNFFTFDN